MAFLRLPVEACPKGFTVQREFRSAVNATTKSSATVVTEHFRREDWNPFAVIFTNLQAKKQLVLIENQVDWTHFRPRANGVSMAVEV